MDTLHPRLGKYILFEGLKTWQVHFIGRPKITWKVDTSSTNCGPYKTRSFRATPGLSLWIPTIQNSYTTVKSCQEYFGLDA